MKIDSRWVKMVGGGGELGECREIIVKTQIRLRRQCCDMIVSEITVGAKHKFVFKKRKEKRKGGEGKEVRVGSRKIKLE